MKIADDNIIKLVSSAKTDPFSGLQKIEVWDSGYIAEVLPDEMRGDGELIYMMTAEVVE